MEDEEIIESVGQALNTGVAGITLQPLGGKQGLFVCRVKLPDNRSYVFKAVKDSCRIELLLTSKLGMLVPGSAPPVIHCEEDTQRNIFWYLSEDMGARRLSDAPSIENYKAVASMIARVQLALMENPEIISGASIPLVDTKRWLDIAMLTLEAEEECKDPLVAKDLKELDNTLWSIEPVITDSSVLPVSLVHGDLHADNVALPAFTKPGICLLDWGSAYLGSCVLGLNEILWPAARYLRTPQDLLQIKAAYLREMSPVLGKPGRLERAAAACNVLSRMQLLLESMCRRTEPLQHNFFISAVALRHFLEAFSEWKKTHT